MFLEFYCTFNHVFIDECLFFFFSGKFGAGDKVTFNGKDYLCNKCLDALERAGGSPTKGTAGRPRGTSTPAKPDMVDGHMNDDDGVDSTYIPWPAPLKYRVALGRVFMTKFVV